MGKVETQRTASGLNPSPGVKDNVPEHQLATCRVHCSPPASSQRLSERERTPKKGLPEKPLNHSHADKENRSLGNCDTDICACTMDREHTRALMIVTGSS